MSKWKCEICNSEFDNFQAEGFNNKIYCPLCYFKELNNRKDKEIERLTAESTEWESKCYKYQDIINELEKYLYNEYLEWKDSENQSLVDKAFEDKEIYDYLKELKEGKE